MSKEHPTTCEDVAEELESVKRSLATLARNLRTDHGITIQQTCDLLNPPYAALYGAQKANTQLLWDTVGTFLCHDCGRESDKMAEDTTLADAWCPPCHARACADQANTDRLNCVGTPYQY